MAGTTIVSTGYGKNAVRIMRVKKDRNWYSICELRLNVELQLSTTKDYKSGDNSDVVATDSMKNTIHVMAKSTEVISMICLINCRPFTGDFSLVQIS